MQVNSLKVMIIMGTQKIFSITCIDETKLKVSHSLQNQSLMNPCTQLATQIDQCKATQLTDLIGKEESAGSEPTSIGDRPLLPMKLICMLRIHV